MKNNTLIDKTTLDKLDKLNFGKGDVLYSFFNRAFFIVAEKDNNLIIIDIINNTLNHMFITKEEFKHSLQDVYGNYYKVQYIEKNIKECEDVRKKHIKKIAGKTKREFIVKMLNYE